MMLRCSNAPNIRIEAIAVKNNKFFCAQQYGVRLRKLFASGPFLEWFCVESWKLYFWLGFCGVVGPEGVDVFELVCDCFKPESTELVPVRLEA